MSTAAVRGSSRLGRPNYPLDFKRSLAALACTGPISVAKLAQEHGVNPNMLFKWRRQYRAGEWGTVHGEQAILLPVRTPPEPVKVTRTGPAVTEPCLEIEVSGVILRVRGNVDATQLRTVLNCLGR